MRGMVTFALDAVASFVAITAGTNDTVAADGMVRSSMLEHMVVSADENVKDDSDGAMDRNGDSTCEANDATDVDTLASRTRNSLSLRAAPALVMADAPGCWWC